MFAFVEQENIFSFVFFCLYVTKTAYKWSVLGIVSNTTSATKVFVSVIIYCLSVSIVFVWEI